ncbi:MAG: PEP-CTERM sorting domain-containing protein [Phycisphaerales bacterium]|nr:PEP-CTERM sorting domain-containing protein [Phycisphaerales bacterium]MCB9855669.1 PEP-CTERM sorting domain-containing protein [Phycisphaerales bacterium]MCB9862564.1 PEP-CTERM sorting domain-containing protein [Phycisphaerales bacterium]
MTVRSRFFVATLFAALLGLSASSVATAGNVTRFTVVDSSSSSWVARGYSDYTVTEQIGWMFSVSRNFDNGVSFLIQGTPLSGTTVDYWRLEFAAPFDAVITPGLYPNFQRFPFQDADRPGMGFSSTGRGDNMASGTYEVFEATYAPDGTVLSFSADITHYGETNPNNWAMLEIRYNVPEPAVAALLMVGAAVMSRRRRRC